MVEMTEEIKDAPKANDPAPKVATGRPARDWDALFQDWLKSGLTRAEYLKTVGINPRSGSANKNTANWERHVVKAHEQVAAQISTHGSRKNVDLVQTTNDTPQGEKVAGLSSQSWKHVQDWRNGQVISDWRTTDTIRAHINSILKRGWQRVEVRNEAGKLIAYENVSTLTPSEIRQLSTAAAEVQRVQRLALGLSTENIGLEAIIENADSNVEKTGTPADKDDKPRNLFIVEMSKNGKFVRARPRQAS